MSHHGPEPHPLPSSATDEEIILLTFPQASRASGISESTLRRAVKSGKLRTHKVGKFLRIQKGDLKSYIASLRTSR